MPFTVSEFLDVFGRYNEAAWPAQIALLLLALAAVRFAAASSVRASVAASAILAAFWAWAGLAYHLAFFAQINPVARVFGAAFVVQALLIVILGIRQRRIEFRARRDTVTLIAALIIAYALIGYPALGYALGHRYPSAPTFGVPCPTTIFTFGLMLLAGPRLPRVLLIIPTLWALVATSAALSLGMIEDLGLPITAAVVVGISLFRRGAATPGEAHASPGAVPGAA